MRFARSNRAGCCAAVVAVAAAIYLSLSADGRAADRPAPAPAPVPAPAQPAAPARPVAPARAANPHFTADGCAACHAVADGKAQPIPPAKVDGVCLACHDGARASEEPHASGVPANPAHVDPGWPLVRGNLSCLTCHDIIRGCGANAAKKPARREEARLLRAGPVGAEAPRPQDRLNRDLTTTFCANCHQPSSFSRHNPHLMLGDDGKALQERCDFCHDKPLDAKAMARTGNAALRKPETALCASCHSPHPDPAPKGHMGAAVPADQQAYMRAREVVGLLNSPAKRLLEQLKQQKARPTLMPLAQGDAMGCTTCHNPHQNGTFPRTSPLAYRAMRVVDGRTVSPVRGENWCRHCHEF